MKIVVATTTLYPLDTENNRIRASLAIDFMGKVLKSGYELAVVDGNSSKDFLNKMESKGIQYEFMTNGTMGVQRRQAFEIATSMGDIICWSEPEKISLIDSIPQLVKIIEKDEADIVIPKRSSLKSYPHFQQKTELLVNEIWNKVTGIDNDICFGPRVFKKELASFFLHYSGDYGDRWESTFLPIMDILKADKTLVNDVIDYIHPSDQTHNEENNIELDLKRVDQLNTLSHAFHTYWNR